MAFAEAPQAAQSREKKARAGKASTASAAEAPKKPALTSQTFGGLRARLIGPAVTSGRVMTLAVHPDNTGIIYMGAASGGVWKTTNGGASWKPIFDKEGSFSIGWITLDPKNPNVVWVGTGERNSQRSVAYGDGVYKSEDGGKSWKNMGLKNFEHIGRVPVNSENTDIVTQKRHDDLVLGTFGRGVYVVDDYRPLRTTTLEMTSKPATLVGARDALLYVPTQRYGGRGKAFQGEMLYAADNPPYGAVITYHLKDGLKTLRQKRVDAEKAADKAGKPIEYPTFDALRAESEEEAATILLTVSDESGTPVRTITGPHRRVPSRGLGSALSIAHVAASTSRGG